MNTIVTSREEILKASRELIRQEGWSAISIRSVAAACGVSVGSIYNYFDSKTELVSATVESVWEEIFHRPENADMFQNIVSCITWMFERMAYGSRQYPGFFTLHSLSFMQTEKLANVLFSLMLSALLREDYDPSAILEIVRRLLY